MPVIRISRGSFKPEDYDQVKARLAASEATLAPAITSLPGLLHYYAGVDSLSNTMVNVSVWESLAAARQMETLAPMLALAGEFSQLGVSFERPIINYDLLWEL